MGVAGIEEAEAAADLMRANIDRKEAAKGSPSLFLYVYACEYARGRGGTCPHPFVLTIECLVLYFVSQIQILCKPK